MKILYEGESCNPNYKPLEALIKFGFAEVCFGKWAGDKVKITANGRKYFEENSKTQPSTNEQS